MIQTAGHLNIIHGVDCPPVVCTRGQFAFEWWNGHRWESGDQLPDRILALLPDSEIQRCSRHSFRRMADRKAS